MDILYCQVKENLSLWLKVSRSTPGSHHQQGTPIRDPPVSSRGGAGHSNSRMLFQKRSTGSVWLSCGHMVSDGNFQGWILASSNRSSQQDQGLKSSDRSGPVPVAIRLLLHLYGAGCSLYIPGSCALQSHSPDIGLQAGLSPWEALGGGEMGKWGKGDVGAFLSLTLLLIVVLAVAAPCGSGSCRMTLVLTTAALQGNLAIVPATSAQPHLWALGPAPPPFEGLFPGLVAASCTH